MRALNIAALFLCAFVPTVALAAQDRGMAGAWMFQAASMLDSVTDYLSNRIDVSGSSTQNNDRSAGHLALAGNGIIWSRHELGLRFRDTASRKEGDGEQSLALRYAMPLMGNHMELEVEESEFRGVVKEPGQQLDTSGNRSFYRLTATRSLGSFLGVDLHQVIRHTGSTRSVFEESEWVHDSSHQLSSIGLKSSSERELIGGLRASTHMTAVGGMEYHSTEYVDGETEDRAQFHRIELAALLQRQVLNWDLNLGGRYQFAPEDLPGSERITVGGSALISGFNGQAVTGTEGGWLRFNAASPAWHVPFASRFQSSLSLSVMRGWAPDDTDNDQRLSAVSAGEISLNINSDRFRANMTVGRLLNSDRSDVVVPSAPDVALSLQMGI
ncbi:hypothetical protein SAMN04487961_0960 [Marinobacter pelagius]|uniref:Haemolysin activator HlyB C-terminal domain-containing protein n=2 Tax=Marinobacter pelagius TaxID=379482 RepID=A0A1I4T292_9GAMM|nr:hypothetical protein SAMN04487961_0960 [Marinobacter pelagius]